MKETEIYLQDNFAVEEAAEFRLKVYELIEKGEINFVINFSNCNFIDSTGLGVLVAVFKKCKMHNGNVRLTSINNSDVLKVFKLTRLDRVFDID